MQTDVSPRPAKLHRSECYFYHFLLYFYPSLPSFCSRTSRHGQRSIFLRIKATRPFTVDKFVIELALETLSSLLRVNLFSSSREIKAFEKVFTRTNRYFDVGSKELYLFFNNRSWKRNDCCRLLYLV